MANRYLNSAGYEPPQFQPWDYCPPSPPTPKCVACKRELHPHGGVHIGAGLYSCTRCSDNAYLTYREGGDAAKEKAALDKKLNWAARLGACAAFGGITIGHALYQILRPIVLELAK